MSAATSEYLNQPIRTLNEALLDRQKTALQALDMKRKQAERELDRLRNGTVEEYAVLQRFKSGRVWVEMEPGMTRAKLVQQVADGQFGDPDRDILLIRMLLNGRYSDQTEAILKEAEELREPSDAATKE